MSNHTVVHLADIKEHAKALYYKHMGLGPVSYDFMWGQCSPEYKEAWMLIARTDLVDPAEEI